MSQRIGITSLLAVLVALGLVLVLGDDSPDDAAPKAGTAPPSSSERRVERINEGTTLRVVEADGTNVLRYSIAAFNKWTQVHWDEVFAERPSFGEIRPVDFDSFRQFGTGAALSPSGDVLAFSVSDYAAATTLSFVAFLELESETVALVDDANRGRISELHWSPNGRYVAYRLNTARAHGEGLSVDRVRPAEKMVSLTGTDVLAALDEAKETTARPFLPKFGDLTWTNENRLSFTSHSPTGEQVRWQIEGDEAPLKRID